MLSTINITWQSITKADLKWLMNIEMGGLKRNMHNVIFWVAREHHCFSMATMWDMRYVMIYIHIALYGVFISSMTQNYYVNSD